MYDYLYAHNKSANDFLCAHTYSLEQLRLLHNAIETAALVYC